MDAEPLELSVVMPCLDEADTLATCIGKARRAMDENGIAGEVIVADNGSRDDSVAIAEKAGAGSSTWRSRATAARSWAGSPLAMDASC